jgi:hypothetical protein
MIQFLFWAVIAAFIGGCVVCLQLGYHWGRQDHPAPEPAGPDPFAEDTSLERDLWAEQLEVWLAEDAAAEPAPLERLVAAAGQVGERTDTADLLHPHKHLADTGELRALAYTGDTAALEADTAAFMAALTANDKIDEEGTA